MLPALLDSSVYIWAVRRGAEPTVAHSLVDPGTIDSGTTMWLSAVVLQELYTGVNDRNRGVIEHLELEFARLGRILVPDLDDWTMAGRALAKVAVKYGYEHIGRGRLTNDALIAASASREGVRIITSNGRDFSRLAEFCPCQWQPIAL
jgi:predicted nucleic acid-binding protein